MLERTVTLYLLDRDENGNGDAKGCLECTAGNWEGVAYKIPRTQKERCDKQCDDSKSTLGKRLKQPGLYFLFGKDPDSGKKTVYVGKADSSEGVWHRVNGKHNGNIDKGWTEAVIFVHAKKASFLGGTGLSYLENKFYKVANKANRAGCYKMLNGSEPPFAKGSITPGHKSEAEDFANHIKTVMSVLGYGDLFAPSEETTKDEEGELFYLTYKKNHSATMKRIGGKFILQEGSWINPDTTTCLPHIIRLREENAEKIRNNKLMEDITVNSPSAATGFVTGANLNGKDLWKNSEGISLNDLEKEKKELQDDE